MNYTQTLEYIHSLGNFSRPAGLCRITAAAKALGSPQKNFYSVHIAGTNGKGSVSAMLANIFKEAGFKTGLFISPYIIDFRERIQINGEFISENDLVRYAEMVRSTGMDLSEFEFITAAAFLYFSDKKCDVVIAETGLGGRLDATNILESPVTVITKIGLDHSAVLGNTVEKIAAEKCGIIKESRVTVSSYDQPEGALRVIEGAADRLVIPDKSQLHVISCDESGSTFLYKGKKYEICLTGKHQIENALTVIETAVNSGFEISYETVAKALKETFFPARAEIICKKPLVLLDGAHNPDGAKALAGILAHYAGKVTAVIGMMRDKDCASVLAATLPFCKSAVAVTVENMPRSLKAEELAEKAEKYCPCLTADSYRDAIEKSYSLAGGEPVFVFGSLYLAGGIREQLKMFYKNLK